MTRFISILVFAICYSVLPQAQALDFIVNGQFNPTVSQGYQVQIGDTFGGYSIFTNDGDWRVNYTQMSAATGSATLRKPEVGLDRFDENGKWVMSQVITVTIDRSDSRIRWNGDPCGGNKIVKISIARAGLDRCAASEIMNFKLGGVDTETLMVRVAETNEDGRVYMSSFLIHFAQLGLTRVEVMDKSSDFNRRLKDWMGKLLDATVKAAGYNKPPDAFKGIPTFSEGTGIGLNSKSSMRTPPVASDRANSLGTGDYEGGIAALEKQDYATAFKKLKTAATQGDAKAQFNLGVMYETGQGIVKDYAEAVFWYKLAAEQSYVRAQSNLGAMYEMGQGVAQNYAEAVRWYKMAAGQGDAKVQFNLGQMHQKGLGVVKDPVEAMRWIKLAAEQGEATAQGVLAVHYAMGDGVVQDYAKAYMWSNIAEARGDTKAGEMRKLLGTQMTAPQITEAQKMAIDCQARKFRQCD